MNNLRIINSPVVFQCLCSMRDKNTNSHCVRIAARKITRILLYEASKNLPLVNKEIETPVAKFYTQDIADDINIIISPILRAGLIFTDEAIDLLPNACIRHIGMFRDEKTLKPVWYYNKVPMTTSNPEKNYVYITDPMLATGNSMLEAVRLYVERNIPVKNIKSLNVVAAPEGIKLLHNEFPELEIITAAVDEGLNEKGYIVPGLGDAGDRIFNTVVYEKESIYMNL